MVLGLASSDGFASSNKSLELVLNSNVEGAFEDLDQSHQVLQPTFDH